MSDGALLVVVAVVEVVLTGTSFAMLFIFRIFFLSKINSKLIFFLFATVACNFYANISIQVELTPRLSPQH